MLPGAPPSSALQRIAKITWIFACVILDLRANFYKYIIKITASPTFWKKSDDERDVKISNCFMTSATRQQFQLLRFLYAVVVYTEAREVDL